MKLYLRKFLVVSLFSLSFLKNDAQQSNKINIVTTSVPFLRISPDARAGGMGDLGIATSPDANAAFWNLAKLPFAKQKAAIALTYTPWLKDLGVNDVYLLNGSGYYKLDDQQTVSASIRYFSLGNMQFTDFAGNNLNSFTPREFSLDLGYARKLSNKLSLGLTFRYISSSLANGTHDGISYSAGNAFAADISLYKAAKGDDGEGLSWGVVLSNLGTKIAYTNDAINKDYIPANLGLGIAYTKNLNKSNRITFGMDVNKLLVPTLPSTTGDGNQDNINYNEYKNSSVIDSWFKSFSDGGSFGNELRELQVSLGAEYVYNNQFSLRTGYFYEDASQGNRKFFTFGAGVKYNVVELNMSYLVPSGQGLNRNPLSNALRFGICFDIK